ncbi:calcium-dependent protein kinase CDPK4 [Besnoitia besnoiti]|uniref:Calcium-dependent protein kinase CDPK4 n=1 Tax=Besnoitia besnoiti TaxID=94643 RepID=A0A2A9M163_BESBE|nr:calcium-dependent protein kinase CDPK4 [Besnoitia besnoiti]PFH32288.1 calcium-dependent protein kinase CDPK4 [Besnoitia besnoiti]
MGCTQSRVAGASARSQGPALSRCEKIGEKSAFSFAAATSSASDPVSLPKTHQEEASVAHAEPSLQAPAPPWRSQLDAPAEGALSAPLYSNSKAADAEGNGSSEEPQATNEGGKQPVSPESPPQSALEEEKRQLDASLMTGGGQSPETANGDRAEGGFREALQSQGDGEGGRQGPVEDAGPDARPSAVAAAAARRPSREEAKPVVEKASSSGCLPCAGASRASRWFRPLFSAGQQKSRSERTRGRFVSHRFTWKSSAPSGRQRGLSFRDRLQRKFRTSTVGARGGFPENHSMHASVISQGASARSSTTSFGGRLVGPALVHKTRCPRCGRNLPPVPSESLFSFTGAQRGRHPPAPGPGPAAAESHAHAQAETGGRAPHECPQATSEALLATPAQLGAPFHPPLPLDPGPGLARAPLAPNSHRPYFDRLRPGRLRAPSGAQSAWLSPVSVRPSSRPNQGSASFVGCGTLAPATGQAPGGRAKGRRSPLAFFSREGESHPAAESYQGRTTPLFCATATASEASSLRRDPRASSPSRDRRAREICTRCGWPGPPKKVPERPFDPSAHATHHAARRQARRPERGLSSSTLGSEVSVPPEFVVTDPLSFFNSLTRTPLFSSRIKTQLKLEQVYEVSSHVLGTGISGAVRIAKHRQSGRKVAVKTLSLSSMAPKKTLMLYNEVSIYLQVDHPNICKLLEVFVDDGEETAGPRRGGSTCNAPGAPKAAAAKGDSPAPAAAAGESQPASPAKGEAKEVHASEEGRGGLQVSPEEEKERREEARERRASCVSRTSRASDDGPKRRIHLVMELCTGKELYDRLAKKKRYSEKDAARVTRQMLFAINYCHQRHICHRDLKLENWVYRDNSDDAPLKLIDFGFSRIFHPGALMTAMHGTVYYVAPEVMDGKYNEKCDLWSIGVIVYMLLSGSPPFTGQGDHDILIKIRRCMYTMSGPRWQGISEHAKDFIRSLLMRNPDERPSAEDALKHPWLLDVEKEALADIEIDVSVIKSMQKFAACSAIKRASLGLIAMSMNSELLDDLERLFRKIDVDNSGCIKMDRMVAVLVTFLDIPRDEALRIFRRIDQTGAEEINYSEFLAATLQTRMALNQQLIREAFERFDVDNSGHISLDNLRYVLGDSYDSVSVEEILRQCDRKQNGVIEFDEFMLALTGDDAEVLERGNAKELAAQGEALTAQVSRHMSELADAVQARQQADDLSAVPASARERAPVPAASGMHSREGEYACQHASSSIDATTRSTQDSGSNGARRDCSPLSADAGEGNEVPDTNDQARLSLLLASPAAAAVELENAVRA